LKIQIETRCPREGVAVIVVTGEMDVHTAPRLRDEIRRLLEEGVNRLVVDLHSVDHLDSTALGILISALRRTTESGGALRLLATPRVQRIFEMTGLNKVFQVAATEEEALSQL
jgi:anti-sigma B factor antagonist